LGNHSEPREEALSCSMSVQAAEKRRAEIRKLVEQIQRAVSTGRVRFTPELDRRIREQIRQTERSQELEAER
jgi:hypothetical protein